MVFAFAIKVPSVIFTSDFFCPTAIRLLLLAGGGVPGFLCRLWDTAFWKMAGAKAA